MSLRDAGKVSTKILVVALFIALAVLNFQIVVPMNSTETGLDLASVKLEAFIPSATAEDVRCGLVWCLLPSGYMTTGCARTFTSACGTPTWDCGC